MTYLVRRENENGDAEFFTGLEKHDVGHTIFTSAVIFDALEMETEAEAKECVAFLERSGLDGFEVSEILDSGSSIEGVF